MFNVARNSGFQIQFNNGYTVSCQFSTFNYCSRRSFDALPFEEQKELMVESGDCELAVISPNPDDGKSGFVTGRIIEEMGLPISNDGMVAGYVSADEAGKIIAYVMNLEA